MLTQLGMQCISFNKKVLIILVSIISHNGQLFFYNGSHDVVDFFSFVPVWVNF